MKSGKKVLGAFLALIMSISALAGCTNTPATSSNAPANSETPVVSEDAPKEPAKISISYIREANNPVDAKDLFAAKNIAEDLNLDITWLDWGVDGGAYQEKLDLAIGGGGDGIPDIFYCQQVETVKKYIADGVALCIDDYIDNYENLKKYMDRDDVREAITYADDGKLYSVCALYTEPVYWFGLLARKDIMDETGYEYDGTTEGYKGLLKAMKDKTGVAPYSTRHGVYTTLGMWGSSFGLDWEQLFFDDETNQYIISCIDDRFFNQLTYMKSLYEEGLMDEEWAINTGEMWEEKMTTSKALSTIDYMVRCEAFTDAVLAEEPDSKFELNAIALPTSDPKYKPYLWTNSQVTDYNAWLVNAETKEPEACMAALDYVYSDKVKDWTNYGEEGVTFEYVDGKPTLKDCVPCALNDFKAVGEPKEVKKYAANRIQFFGMITDTEAYFLNSFGRFSYPGVQLYRENGWIMKLQPAVPASCYSDDDRAFLTDAVELITAEIGAAAQDFIEGARPLTKEEYAKFQDKILVELEGNKVMEIENNARKKAAEMK